MSSSLELIKIVSERLKADGYDGLYNDLCQCDCNLQEELMPCENPFVDCVAGWILPPDLWEKEGVESANEIVIRGIQPVGKNDDQIDLKLGGEE